jgi:hypothetical protein
MEDWMRRVYLPTDKPTDKWETISLEQVNNSGSGVVSDVYIFKTNKLTFRDGTKLLNAFM